ncbi:MAG: hypothetical protein OEY09_08930 [Gammaproteobacteria bacterium]|nr:hypothetical protein [Gammaproteobacteria bacterium]
MSKSLDNALAGGPWSVSAIIFDLNDTLDEEGRPISERRADASARVGVEMEMRECPFAGIRHNKLMNVSALAQITRYFNKVQAEIATFRRQAGGETACWDDILAGVIDQLAGPAIYLLQQRNDGSLIPAQIAVGHKVAAGFFGVLRGIHERLILGGELPMSVESFMQQVDKQEALVGASEVCAGSPKMIGIACAALIEGTCEQEVEFDPLRIDVARCLALQVQLGIFWDLYDRVHLWSLVRGEFRERLTPGNSFLKGRLETIEKGLDENMPSRPDSDVLPDTLDAEMRRRLTEALNEAAEAEVLERDLQDATELLKEGKGIIGYNGNKKALALSVANYLNTYRLIETELSRIELQLREHLGFPGDSPIRLGSASFPAPQALPLYELTLGRRLGEDGHLTGSSVGTRVA